MSKKVSIIIPVYNGSNYLKEAIDSALAQTYKNIEIIVVNDGSTDNGATKKIAESYGNKIKYYEKENGGAASALNYGISKMTGDYMSWLSHDDLYYPNKVERQMEEIQKHDEKTILFSNFDFINPQGEKTDTIIMEHKMLLEKPDYAVLRGCIGGITLLIPKKALEECGSFREDLRCVQDYEMWFRMLKGYHFVHMEDVLSMTRIHPLQDTQVSPKVITEGNWLWKYLTEEYPDNKKVKYEGSKYLFYQEMYNYLKNTPYKEAEEKAWELAEECLKETKQPIEDITVVIVENGDEKQSQKTMNSIKKQKYSHKKIITTKTKDILNKIDTPYYTFVHAGIEVANDWLEKQMIIAGITKKGVIISDYPRPLKTGKVDNICSLLVPIDGVILKKYKEIKYKNDYQLLLDTAKQMGSFVTDNQYLSGRIIDYNMKDVYDYLEQVIKGGQYYDYQLAALNYDIACIFNQYGKSQRKVSMYEPCDEYRTLKFSRSFQWFKKYYDYKKKKKKRL